MGFVLQANPYNFDYPDNAYGFTFYHPKGQGVASLCPELPQILADMQSVGATLLNYQIDWYRVETSQGHFQFGALDAAVNACNQAGINLMFDLFNAPSWWLTRVCSCDSTYSFADVTGITNFAVAIAQRYNGVFNVPGYGPLKIQALMVGNEDFDFASAPVCCRDLGGQYLAPVMVNLVPAVAAVNSSVLVLPACLLRQDATHVANWIAAYYAGGAGPYTKVMHIHFYKGTNDPLTTGYTWDDAWQALDNANITAGYTHMPIWVTEYGWPISTQGHPAATTPALQWQYMQEMLNNSRTNGRVMKLLWYEIGTYDGDSLTQGGLVAKQTLSGTLAANTTNVTSIPITSCPYAIPQSVLGVAVQVVLGYGSAHPQTVTLSAPVNLNDTTMQVQAFTVNSTGFSSGASLVPTETYVQPTWSNLQASIAANPAWAFKNNNVGSSYAQAILADGALAYYRLDEAVSGITSAWDSSGNFYTATVAHKTLGATGAIVGDTDTAMNFLSNGTFTLPSSLNYSAFPACSVEFWTYIGGAWHHVVAVSSSTSSTTLYKDTGLDTTLTGRPALSTLLSYYGSFSALDEIAIYNYALTLTQITNHFTLAGGTVSTGGSGYTIGSGSSEDLNLYKKQLVKIYTSDFQSNYFGADSAFLGLWPDAPLLSGFKESLNGGIDPIVIELPRLWDSISTDPTIAQGNLVQYWLVGPGLPATGKLRYQGVIDKYEPAIDAAGKESIKITITPYSSAIADRGIVATLNFGTAGQGSTFVDPVQMFSYFFNNTDPLTGYPYLLPLFWNPANPSSSGRTLQYSFQQQQFDSIFNTILLMLPNNWFYRVNCDRSVDLNVTPVTPQHIFFVGQHLVEPAYSQDATTLKNLVSLQGKGTLQTTVAGSDTKIYGAHLYQKADSRITDASTLETIANSYLALLDQVLLRCPIKVYDYRGDTQYGIGYDIESIKVGDTVMFVNTAGAGLASVWDSMKWDTDAWDASGGAIFNTVVQVIELTYGFDFVQLQLGSPQPNVNRSLFKIGQDLQDFTIINT